MRKPPEADETTGGATAALRRAGGGAVLEARLRHNVGGVLYTQKRFDEALAEYRLALAQHTDLLGEDDPQVAATRAEVHRAEARQGQVFAARTPELQVIGAIATGLRAELTDPDGNGVQSVDSAYDFQLSDLSATFAVQARLIQPL